MLRWSHSSRVAALLLIFGPLGCGGGGGADRTAPVESPVFVSGDVDIIPLPASVAVDANRSVFALNARTRIFSDPGRSEVREVAEFLHQALQRHFPSIAAVAEHVDDSQPSRSILLTTADSDHARGDESYELLVTSEHVVIRAPAPAGLMYGVQSLRQLAPIEIEASAAVAGFEWAIPSVNIHDHPRFPWRGFMLDVSRTFYPKEFLLRYIDLLSLYKMNKLHLHLTDDQGWRIESETHPELHTVGSLFDRQLYPNERSGYYTKDDLREIVDYAARAQIEIIPEIDLPGHSVAMLRALPELACATSPEDVRTTDEFVIVPWTELPPFWTPPVLCACDERLYEVLEDVLDEVIEIFPSHYIHLGGDEVATRDWEASYLCQGLIRDGTVSGIEHIQAFFTKRMEDFLLSRGRALLGWDEVQVAALEADESARLSDTARSMHWRFFGSSPEWDLFQRDVIQTPWWALYLDVDAPLETTYLYDPVSEELTPEQAAHVLGAQASMWTAFTNGRTEDEVDRRVFPRLLAIAELTWSPRALRNFEYFEKRRAAHTPRLDLLGVARSECEGCLP